MHLLAVAMLVLATMEPRAVAAGAERLGANAFVPHCDDRAPARCRLKGVFGRAHALLRRGRTAAICCALALGGVVALAHTTVDDHHVGQAVSLCLAIGVAAVAAAATPRLGRLLPAAPRPRDAVAPDPPSLDTGARSALARGDPAVLQVFRC